MSSEDDTPSMPASDANTSIRRNRKRRKPGAPMLAAAHAPAAEGCASPVASSLDDDRSLKHARSTPAAAASAFSVPVPSASPPGEDPFAFPDDSASSYVRAAGSTSVAPAAAINIGSAVPENQAEGSDEEQQERTSDRSSRLPCTYLIHSAPYAQLLDLQTVHCERMKLFTSLLRSLQADTWSGLRIVPPRRASMKEMEEFHSRAYLTCMRDLCRKFVRHPDTGAVELVHELTAAEKEAQEAFGLLDDCCVFPELFDMVQFTVGGTLRAVEHLMEAHAAQPLAPVTVCHWGGGRHHAEAECAKGFCFCGDVVCACLRLLAAPAYPRVLYLDIDLHHGDGVEEAFSAAQLVLTCSFHHLAPGFFPGTGHMDTEGKANARHSLVNIPLHEGIDDVSYCMLFDGVLSLLLPSFRPSVVVVCAGVDGLANDRMSPFNLTTRTYAKCVQILKKKLGHYVHMEPPANNGATGAAGATSAAESPAAPAAALFSPLHPTSSIGVSSAQPVTSSDLPQVSSTCLPSQLTSASSSSETTAVPPALSDTSASGAHLDGASLVAGTDSATALPASSVPATHPSLAHPDPAPVGNDVKSDSQHHADGADGTCAEDASQAVAPESGSNSSVSACSFSTAPIPLLLLGGGGYCPTDAARAFVHMTAAACSHRLPASLPDHDRFLPSYLPNLSMHSLPKPPGVRPNRNTRAYLLQCMRYVRDKCRAREKQEREEEGMLDL